MLPTLNYLATERLPPPDMRVFGTPRSPFSGKKELPGSRRAPISLFTEHSVNFLQSLRSIATRQLGSRNIAPEALEKVYGQPGKPFFALFNDKETPPSTETQHVTRSALRTSHFPRQRYQKENAHKVRLAKPLFVDPQNHGKLSNRHIKIGQKRLHRLAKSNLRRQNDGSPCRPKAIPHSKTTISVGQKYCDFPLQSYQPSFQSCSEMLHFAPAQTIFCT